MYSYNFDKDESKISLEDREGKVLQAVISVEEKVAKATFVYLREMEKDSLFSLVSSFCNESKNVLNENGIDVEKVVCGRFLDVLKYDEIYENIGKELISNKSRISKR